MVAVGYIASNWERPWATETQLALDLERDGHTVVRIPEGAPQGRVERLVREHDLRVVLFTKAKEESPPGYPGLFERLEQQGVRTASYHLDLFVGLPREREI